MWKPYAGCGFLGDDNHLHRQNYVVGNSFYHLCKLYTVWWSLTLDAWWTLATMNRFDYCNAVLHGATMQVMQRLQMVINATAHMVTGYGKYKHITSVLRDFLC